MGRPGRGPFAGRTASHVGFRTRMSTLLVFTESFPYEAALEDTFLTPELPHLRAAFDRVVLIPSSQAGRRINVLDGIEVVEDLAALLAAHSGRREVVARAALSRLFRTDIAERPSLLSRRRALARLAVACGRAELTRAWMNNFLPRQGLAPVDCVAYTFWCDPTTAGLALVKAEYPDLVVISRAHGADLYAERYDPPYLPCRRFTLRYLDRLLPDSEHGVRYMADRYAWFGDRCEVARMGVPDPAFYTVGSGGGRCVLVSCSRLVPIKRVDLILRGINQAARLRPATQFEWFHFGEGPLKTAIEAQAAAILGMNVRANFPGYTTVNDLFEFYRAHPIDAFINASASEGTPVSIMEAISCGMPVIATAVGGNPEIVSAVNGWLLEPNPSPGQIAEAILAVVDRPDTVAPKRRASRHTWETRYSAVVNYTQFARLLAGIRAAR
jgi:glycosyltransferase involved in cell wall biosynthesis